MGNQKINKVMATICVILSSILILLAFYVLVNRANLKTPLNNDCPINSLKLSAYPPHYIIHSTNN